MSMNAAINNALLGLAWNTRAAEIVSTNVSNAADPGYARRELVQGQVQRISDPVLLSERRLSDAEMAFAQTQSGYAQSLEPLSAGVEVAGSLQNLLVGFDTALMSAAADPSSTQRLSAVAIAGEALAQGLNGASRNLQDLRGQADAAIAKDVGRLNDLLRQTAQLNRTIVSAQHGGAAVATILDQRDSVIDEIAAIVPVRIASRDGGAVALYTMKGALLLDGSPAEIGFSSTPVIGPQMSVDNGLVSGFTLNGRAISGGHSGPLSGGRLGAHVIARDSTLPEYQARLDAFARDLVDRFGSGGPDATLAPGNPGLFSDWGVQPTLTDNTGLSGRITWNADVAPNSQTIWKLRDGLGAAAPGHVGEARLLKGLRTALVEARTPVDPALGSAARASLGHMTDFAADLSFVRIHAEDALSRAEARNIALKEAQASNGVDTDVEMQRLLLIEQAFAANARVLQAADDMTQTLLNI